MGSLAPLNVYSLPKNIAGQKPQRRTTEIRGILLILAIASQARRKSSREGVKTLRRAAPKTHNLRARVKKVQTPNRRWIGMPSGRGKPQGKKILSAQKVRVRIPPPVPSCLGHDSHDSGSRFATTMFANTLILTLPNSLLPRTSGRQYAGIQIEELGFQHLRIVTDVQFPMSQLAPVVHS